MKYIYLAHRKVRQFFCLQKLDLYIDKWEN